MTVPINLSFLSVLMVTTKHKNLNYPMLLPIVQTWEESFLSPAVGKAPHHDCVMTHFIAPASQGFSVSSCHSKRWLRLH